MLLSLAAHYIQVLKCRQQCVLEIATKPGRISATEDFIPSHLDLLQFAYDQGEQSHNPACVAVAPLKLPFSSGPGGQHVMGEVAHSAELYLSLPPSSPQPTLPRTSVFFLKPVAILGEVPCGPLQFYLCSFCNVWLFPLLSSSTLLFSLAPTICCVLYTPFFSTWLQTRPPLPI